MFNESNALVSSLKCKRNVSKINISFFSAVFDIIALPLDNQRKLGKFWLLIFILFVLCPLHLAPSGSITERHSSSCSYADGFYSNNGYKTDFYWYHY